MTKPKKVREYLRKGIKEMPSYDICELKKETTNKKLEEEIDKIYESGFWKGDVRKELKSFIRTNYISREEIPNPSYSQTEVDRIIKKDYIPREEVEKLIKSKKIYESSPRADRQLPAAAYNQAIGDILEKLKTL